MGQRINAFQKGQEAMATLFGIGKYLSKSSLGAPLLHLIYFRVSQINGCAFCLDMHAKDMRESGESEQRLYVLNAWRDAPFYSDRERAALAWAEAVTKCEVPDNVYQDALKQFTEEELIDLTFAVTTINTYNRINIAFTPLVGTYKVGQFAAV